MSSPTPNSPPQTVTPLAGSVSAVVGFLVFVELTSGFLQGFYMPLFGAIAEHLQISDADITWFNTVQVLAAGVCVPVLSKLGDIFGHRRILRLTVIAVFIGTALVAFSPSYELVLLGRVLLGPMAVWLPLEIALVHNRIEGTRARRAVGFLVSALTIGAVLGALAGGALGKVIPDLTIVLALPLIIIAVCIVIVYARVPESTIRTAPVIDGWGFIGLAVAMIALLIGLQQAAVSGFSSPGALVPILGALVILVLWVLWERRHRAPAVNVRLIASRTLWPAYLVSFLFGIVLFGTQTITTTFLAADPEATGYGFGLDTLSISLFSAGTALSAAVGAATFSLVARGIGMRGVLILGCAAGAAGQLVLMVGGWGALPMVVLSIVLAGLGGGLLLGALPALVAELSPPDQTGIATGLYNSIKTLGGALAGALFGLILRSAALEGQMSSTINGYIGVWTVCLIALATGILALLVMRTGTRTAQPTVSS